MRNHARPGRSTDDPANFVDNPRPGSPAARSPPTLFAMHFSRHAFYQVLEMSGGRRSGPARAFNLLLIAIIALNALAIVLHTVPGINAHFPRLFLDF